MNDLHNLRNQSYSLAQFCETAKRLLDSDDPASFVNFVLCGRYQDHQVIVDAYQNTLNEQNKIKGLRDFDSLLGIFEDIPVKTYLTLFPLARKEDTLHTNIHLKYSFHITHVSYMSLNRDISTVDSIYSTLIQLKSTKSPTSALQNGTFKT
jgi:hypothetical protein